MANNSKTEIDPSDSNVSKISSVEDITVVDTDAHVSEGVEDILPFMEDRYEGIRRIIANSKDPLTSVYHRTIPAPNPASKFDGVWYGEGNRDVKLKQMDEFDIDYALLGPGLNSKISTVSNSRHAVALANAYNSWILHEFLEEGDRFVSPILVAPQKPDKAAEEIERRAGEDGFIGVGIMLGGLVPPIGDHRYTPIFEAARDHDLPIVMHPGISGMFAQSMFGKWVETFTEGIVPGFPFQLMWNITSLMCQGIPERYPELNFVFQEGGLLWLAYMKGRLDSYYLEKGEDFPFLKRVPSTYIAEQCYITTQPLEHTAHNSLWLEGAVKMAGPSSVMYSSDLPHSDWDTPEELHQRIRGSFDESTTRNMMGETAAAVFDLDL